MFYRVMMSRTHDNVIPLERASRRARLGDHSDDELMRLARANVKEAFAEIVRRYRRLVRGFCCKWSPDRGEDLAQEVFVRLWRSRERYRPKNEFKAYLFTIVVNQCRNDRRTLTRKPPMAPLDPERRIDGDAPDQLDRILEGERLRRVHRGIEALTPKLKEAVLLRYGSEMSYRQMSRILGVNEATIRSRVMLGIQKLQKELF